MRKGLLGLAFLILLFASANAKDVTVIYNFPPGSGTGDIRETVAIPEDWNAYAAFAKVANMHSLGLNISYYDFDGDGIAESAFVNSAGGISASSDWAKYWQFSINNKVAMEGISSYIPKNGDGISFDYLEGAIADAIEWIADNKESNGALGPNLFQSAFASMALSLADDNNAGVGNGTIEGGLDYLLGLQGADAGFGNDLSTAVATMAFLSNGRTLDSFAVNGTTAIETLVANQQPGGGFRSGTAGSDVDTTSWATIAIAHAEADMPLKNGKSPVDYLISAQHSNGSFGYNESDKAESIDFTEEAIIAFAAAGREKDAPVQDAIAWLASMQNENGCIADGFRTALGSITFRVYDEDQKANKAVECLRGMQNGDGSFGRGSNPSNAVDTAIAIVALNEKVFPLNGEPGGGSKSAFGLNTIVKFYVTIKNKGNVEAEDVGITLSGIPDSWIYSSGEGSINFFDKIEPGKTETAEIYVKLKETGSYTVSAIVSATQLSSPLASNNVSLSAEEAMLDVRLSIAG